MCLFIDVTRCRLIATGGLPQDFLFFGRPLDVKSVAGIVLTMAGVFAYTHLKLDKARREKEAASVSGGGVTAAAAVAAASAVAAKNARLEELVSPTSVAAGGVGSTLRAGGGEVEALLGAPDGGAEEETFSPVERERDGAGRGGLMKSATD